MEGLSWLWNNWFELLQSAGIIGGLAFTALTIRSDREARKIENLIAIKDQHRAIWSEIYERPDLLRILDNDVNLKLKPITPEESLFVNLLIIHLATVHRSIESGLFVSLEGIKTDVREFLEAPIPREIWHRVKHFYDASFVAFVEGD